MPGRFSRFRWCNLTWYVGYVLSLGRKNGEWGIKAKKGSVCHLIYHTAKTKAFLTASVAFQKPWLLFMTNSVCNLIPGWKSPGAGKQAGRKWEEGTAATQTCRQQEKQTAGARSVQAGGKYRERERQEGRQVSWNSSSQAGRQAGRQANTVKCRERVHHCRL